jgi:polysaccharide export outer membrane protein
MRNRRSLLLLLVLAVLAACATPGSSLSPLPGAERAAYRLGPDDQVRVSVFSDPRLTGEFRVTDAGMLALPLVGSVAATGRITTEVERAIERGGRFPYEPGMTTLSAVAVAGGFNDRALRDHVAVTRIGEHERPCEFRADRQALLLPGDVVTVFERRF